MFNKIDKNTMRKNKHDRIRFTLKGTSEKPRLNIYRSSAHIYAQIIDDVAGKTLCSSSTLEKTLSSKIAGKTKNEQAYLVGADIAAKAKKLKIKNVVFDRGGYIYTGRVAQLAEGARSGGLEF